MSSDVMPAACDVPEAEILQMAAPRSGAFDAASLIVMARANVRTLLAALAYRDELLRRVYEDSEQYRQGRMDERASITAELSRDADDCRAIRHRDERRLGRSEQADYTLAMIRKGDPALPSSPDQLRSLVLRLAAALSDLATFASAWQAGEDVIRWHDARALLREVLGDV